MSRRVWQREVFCEERSRRVSSVRPAGLSDVSYHRSVHPLLEALVGDVSERPVVGAGVHRVIVDRLADLPRDFIVVSGPLREGLLIPMHSTDRRMIIRNIPIFI